MAVDCPAFQGPESEIKKGTLDREATVSLRRTESEQWLTRPPAFEAGTESTQALSKQSGFSVLNQFEQWLKLVGRGALKACTHPLLSLSQSPGADDVYSVSFIAKWPPR